MRVGLAAVTSWLAAAANAMRTRERARRIAWRLRLARYWQANGDLDEAARHCDNAVRLARRCPSTPAVLAAEAGLTMAHIERDRADYTASHEHLTLTGDLVQTIPPGGDRDRLSALASTGLADLHRRAGRYSDAAAALVQARTLAESAGPSGATRLAAVVMLEGIVAKELGDVPRAGHCYATVAGIHDRDGCTPSDAATLQHNLAGLANLKGAHQRAEEHASRAVALRRTVAGQDRVALAEDLAVLAAAVAGQNRYGEARDLFAQASELCRAARPVRHYEIAVHLHNLAAIEQACGDLEAAERLYRQALALKERLLGLVHPEIALILNNLGTLLHDRHDTAQAAHCYRRALRIADAADPPEHPTLDAVRHNLALIPIDGLAPAGSLACRGRCQSVVDQSSPDQMRPVQMPAGGCGHDKGRMRSVGSLGLVHCSLNPVRHF